MAESRAQRCHLNLAESSRRLVELDPLATVEEGDGWLFAAGRSDHPVISNAAYRLDDGLDPGELIERGRSFFGALGRGFSVWARGGLAEDEELLSAAEEAGLQHVYEMPEMVLEGRPEPPRLPDGAELRRLVSDEQAEDYWRIAQVAYADLGFQPEVFAFNEDRAALRADGTVAYLGYLDGDPVSIALTIVSRGIAGIYWVGSLGAARGQGLGRAVTAAATNAGLDLGADLASLQASPMGRPIYEAMGYERIYDYRMLMSPAP